MISITSLFEKKKLVNEKYNELNNYRKELLIMKYNYDNKQNYINLLEKEIKTLFKYTNLKREYERNLNEYIIIIITFIIIMLIIIYFIIN